MKLSLIIYTLILTLFIISCSHIRQDENLNAPSNSSNNLQAYDYCEKESDCRLVSHCNDIAVNINAKEEDFKDKISRPPCSMGRSNRIQEEIEFCKNNACEENPITCNNSKCDVRFKCISCDFIEEKYIEQGCDTGNPTWNNYCKLLSQCKCDFSNTPYLKAQATKDPSLCVSLKTFRMECVVNIGMETKNSNVCQYVESSDKDGCYHKLAIGLLMPNLCESISYYPGKSSCYNQLAGILKDKSLCMVENRIDHSSNEDYCFN